MERKRKASTVREADGSVHRAIKQAKTEKEQTKRHILAKELYKQKRKNPAAFEPISAVRSLQCAQVAVVLRWHLAGIAIATPP